MRWLPFAVALLCCVFPTEPEAAPLRQSMFIASLDTVRSAGPNTVVIDSASRLLDATSIDSVAVPEKRWPNPTVTLLKSVVVPGWGQITNRRYVKAAIAIGLETWFIYGIASEWNKMNDALERLRQDPNDDFAFYEYDFHRGNRADFLWAMGLTVFVSMFDAYVDAHLRPYDDDTIPDVEPPPGVALVLVRF